MKGVEPIAYKILPNYDHSLLYDTLEQWANIHSLGNRGRQKIIQEEAMKNPALSTYDNDYAGRVLWALSESSGNMVTYFSNCTFVPFFDWYICIKNNRSTVSGIEYTVQKAFKNIFSDKNSLNKLERELVFWITKHLNNALLFKDIALSTPPIGKEFKKQIEQALYADWNSLDNNLRKYWEFFLLDKIKNSFFDGLSYTWLNDLKSNGLTLQRKLQLKYFLSPQIKIVNEFDYKNELQSEIVLVTSKIYALWNQLMLVFQPYSAQLFDLFQQNLLETLQMQEELGIMKDKGDISFLYLPSVSEHFQNRKQKSWTALIELLRDSWLAIYKTDRQKAACLAQNWFGFSYATFKRLALYAARFDDCILSEQWLDWLFEDDCFCLWSPSVMRELMRLLVLQAVNLSERQQLQLEEKLVAGPVSRGLSQKTKDIMILSRLEKLNLVQELRSDEAKNVLRELHEKYPAWELSDNEQEEFAIWMDNELVLENNEQEEEQFNILEGDELTDFIAILSSDDFKEGSSFGQQWKFYCKHNFDYSFIILKKLVQGNILNNQVLEIAFWEWAKLGLNEQSQEELIQMILALPQEIIKEQFYFIANICLQLSQGREICYHYSLDQLFKKMIGYGYGNDYVQPSFYEIFNSPFAMIVLSLINFIQRQAVFSHEIQALLKKLCNQKVISYRYARQIICYHYDFFYGKDPVWTEKYIGALFSWDNMEETRSAWTVIIQNTAKAEIMIPLLKQSFLNCFKYFNLFGEMQEDFIILIRNIIISTSKVLSKRELRSVIPSFSSEHFAMLIKKTAIAMELSDREYVWSAKIKPFWNNIVSKDNKYKSSALTVQLIRMCYWSGNKFPEAFKLLSDWFSPIENSYDLNIIFDFIDNNQKYPEEVLDLLYKSIDNNTYMADNILSVCLDEIKKAKPELETYHNYQVLKKYVE